MINNKPKLWTQKTSLQYFEEEYPCSSESIRNDEREQFKLALLSDKAVEAGDRKMREGGKDSNGNKCYGFSFKDGVIELIKSAEQSTNKKGDTR